MNNKLLSEILKAIEEKKGQDILVLQLSEVCSFTDHFILCTGNTTRQTQAISDAVEEAAAKIGMEPSHIEGFAAGEWILLDFLEVVVHIFTPATRSFYDLERLWRDAPRLEPASLRPAPRARKRKTE